MEASEVTTGRITRPLSSRTEQLDFELTVGTTWVSIDKRLQILIAKMLSAFKRRQQEQ